MLAWLFSGRGKGKQGIRFHRANGEILASLLVVVLRFLGIRARLVASLHVYPLEPWKRERRALLKSSNDARQRVAKRLGAKGDDRECVYVCVCLHSLFPSPDLLSVSYVQGYVPSLAMHRD